MAYTNIDDPSAYFQTTTYTGNGSNGHVITHTGNSDLQADFIWIKGRQAGVPVVYDTNRRPSGTPFSGSLYVLTLGNNYATGAENTGAYGPTAIGSDSVTMNQYDFINKISETFVSWNWKANGGTTASNTSGATTTTVQANQDAGFSILTWSGNGSATTLGHGLGVEPEVIIQKARGTTSNWAVYHKQANAAPYNVVTYLNLTDATGIASNSWGTAASDINSNTFYLKHWFNYNTTNLAYCFASKQGYSKFGKYVGNGSPSGPFVYTGFKPAFVMTKRTDSTSGWVINDFKRSGYNGGNKELFANLDQAEDSDSRYDLLSNGFKIRVNYATSNASGGTYIYMAFAENPFVAGGVPTTAR